MAYVNSAPSGFVSIRPAPEPSTQDEPSVNNVHGSGSAFGIWLTTGVWLLGPEIIAHSIGMTLLLCNVTVPPSTGNFSIPCAVDGTAQIFLMP
ncbi:hypothetical protein Tco_0507122, partial [Tanacetum coccineum]